MESATLSEKTPAIRPHFGWIWVRVAALILLAVLQLAVIPAYLWGVFEYEGWLLIQHVPLYRDIFEINFPLLPHLYALVFLIAPPSTATVSVLGAGMVVAAGTGITALGDRIGGRRCGNLALLAWIGWSSLYTANMPWPNLLAIPLALYSVRWLWHALAPRPRYPALVLSAMLAGLVVASKQSLAGIEPVLLLVVASAYWRDWSRMLRCLAAHAVISVAAFVAAILPTVVTGSTDAFMHGTLGAAVRTGWSPTWNEVATILLILGLPLLAAAAGSVVTAVLRIRRGRIGLMETALLVGVALSVDVVHNLRSGLMLPGVAVLCVLAAAYVTRSPNLVWPVRLRTVLSSAFAGTLVVCVAGVVVARPYDEYAQQLEKWYDAGTWVRKHTSESTKLFVLGAPATYFGAQRLPVSQYINLEPSSRAIPGVESSVIAALRRTRGEVVVYYQVPYVSATKVDSESQWSYNLRIQSYILSDYCSVARLPGEIYVMRESKRRSTTRQPVSCD